jgi:hypothetical protein
VTAYDVIMKSSRTVRSVTWRLDRVEGTAVVPVPGRGERLEGDFIRGVPIELRIPAPPSSGTYRLAICATPRLKLKEHQRPAGLCPKDDIERVYFFDHIPTVTVRAKSH